MVSRHSDAGMQPDAKGGSVELIRMISCFAKIDTWKVWQLSKGFLRLRARVASTIMGHPSRSLKVIGVTGTDGKTTTTKLVEAVLSATGRRVSSISSIGASIGRTRLEPIWQLTTPGPFVLQYLLRCMKHCGSEWAVIEASSHALSQWRLSGIAFHVGVMTNLSCEHLDYHSDMEDYARAKAILFKGLIERGAGKGIIVLNRDDSSYPRFATHAKGQKLLYGQNPEAAVRASAIGNTGNCSTFNVHTPSGQFRVTLPLPGLFNVYNALAAIAVGHSQGINSTIMAYGLSSVSPIEGRMFPIAEGQSYSVMIDHAHTPRAMKEILRFFRERVKERIIVVFGCPGDRWKGKRLPMGEIAGRLADYIVVTREDDRSESVYSIMRDITEGLQRAGRSDKIDYVVLPDRREAIMHACGIARKGDMVLITGKGHERTLNVAGRDIPWNEAAVVSGAIRACLTVSSEARM